VEPVETYGHFTLGAARSLIGKMGTRPFPCLPRPYAHQGRVLLFKTRRL
jgi:hypothetical protein